MGEINPINSVVIPQSLVLRSCFRLNFNTSKLVYLGTLSEDHIGNTMPTGAKMISYSRIEDLNTPALSHDTYPYSPYMGASPEGSSAVYLATFERSSPPPLFPSFTSYTAFLH